MTSFNARLLLVLWAQTRSARPRFTAHAVRDWLGRIGVKTLYIEPGSPWENGYNESFNSKLRDEILNTEIFYTLKEAKVLGRVRGRFVSRSADSQSHTTSSARFWTRLAYSRGT